MRHLVFTFVFLAFSADGAIFAVPDPQPVEQVIAIQQEEMIPTSCSSRSLDGQMGQDSSASGDALFGVLLAAKVSGIEVIAVETDPCLIDFGSR